MTNVTFEPFIEGTDKTFYDHNRSNAMSAISLLTCRNDKEAFAHVSIIANGRNWNIKIIRACCPEFLELAKKAVYPLAE